MNKTKAIALQEKKYYKEYLILKTMAVLLGIFMVIGLFLIGLTELPNSFTRTTVLYIDTAVSASSILFSLLELYCIIRLGSNKFKTFYHNYHAAGFEGYMTMLFCIVNVPAYVNLVGLRYYYGSETGYSALFIILCIVCSLLLIIIVFRLMKKHNNHMYRFFVALSLVFYCAVILFRMNTLVDFNTSTQYKTHIIQMDASTNNNPKSHTKFYVTLAPFAAFGEQTIVVTSDDYYRYDIGAPMIAYCHQGVLGMKWFNAQFPE